MATYKADHLKAMIREVVRQEIKEVVTGVIAEVLSERYLRQLAEVNASRPRGVGRTMHIADGDDQEIEEAPTILPNPTQGIYRKHPMKHSDSIEDEEEPQTTIPEGKQRDEMLALFFEGTKPLKMVEEKVEEGIPLENIVDEPNDGRRPLTEVWRELAGVKKQPAEAAVDTSELEKREELRLKRLRESLERPA